MRPSVDGILKPSDLTLRNRVLVSMPSSLAVFLRLPWFSVKSGHYGLPLYRGDGYQGTVVRAEDS